MQFSYLDLNSYLNAFAVAGLRKLRPGCVPSILPWRKKEKEGKPKLDWYIIVINCQRIKELIPINVIRYNFEKFELCKLQSTLEVKSFVIFQCFILTATKRKELKVLT